MSKQKTVTTNDDLIKDAFLGEVPTKIEWNGQRTPLHRGINPGGFYPRNPYCKSPVDLSNLAEQISQRVRIAPSHLSGLQKANKTDTISRLKLWVNYTQEILPTIFHPVVLSDLFSANLIINIKDFYETQATSPQETESLFGMYINSLNVIQLNIPSSCTRSFIRETIANELTGAIFDQFKEFIHYNPMKLPIPSMKIMHQQMLYAYKIGMARIDTFSRLLDASVLTSREQAQLNKEYLGKIFLSNYRPQHYEMFLEKNQLIALEERGQLLKSDGGFTWQYISADSTTINKTFYHVLYGANPSASPARQCFLYKNQPDNESQKNLTRKAKIFIDDLKRSSRQHQDPLSITVKNARDRNFQIYSLTEAFSGIFESPLSLVQTFFPEICHFLANMSCLPPSNFCNSSTFPMIGASKQLNYEQSLEEIPYEMIPQKVKVIGYGEKISSESNFLGSLLNSAISVSQFLVSSPVVDFLMLLQFSAVKLGNYRDRERVFNVEEQKKLKAHHQKFTELQRQLQPYYTALANFEPGFYTDLQGIIKSLQLELTSVTDFTKGPSLLLERVKQRMSYLEKRNEWVQKWIKTSRGQSYLNNSFNFWSTLVPITQMKHEATDVSLLLLPRIAANLSTPVASKIPRMKA